MITEVTMPKLGLTMDEGTILAWLKSEGDAVQAGEPLLSVETDKVALDVEAPASGRLLKVLTPEGSTVPLGEVIAFIGEPDDILPEPPKPALRPAMPAAQPAGTVNRGPAHGAAGGPVKVSPIARRLAEENNIDLVPMQGSGPQGRIVEADIQAVLEARQKAGPEPAGTAYTLLPLTPVRKVAALRLSESFRTIPHFYLSIEINAALLVGLREELSPACEDQFGVRLTHTDLLLRALAVSLPRHPLLNAAYHSDTEVRVYSEVNPGLAIATEQGLVVAVLPQADRMSLGEIARLRHDLAARAQQRKLTPQDISGGTFTLTNLGMYGVDDFAPIVNPGQSAILAVGAIRERPVGEQGQLVLRPTLRMTLAVDHRVADGAAGALFLQDLRAVLEAPEGLQD